MRLLNRTVLGWLSAAFILLPGAALAQTPGPRPPAVIPGTIEGEDYDPGGEGVTWHLAKARDTARVYRPDAVDIRPVTGGGFAVYAEPGEWLRYTANVQVAGMYTIDVRVAHQTGMDPEIRVLCDGVDVTGSMTVPYTGGSEHWVTVSRPGVTLTAGQHVLRLEFGGGSGFYLDWIRATPGSLPQPGPKPDPAQWELVWGDEFKYTGKPDPTKWDYDTGGGGWGNDELEYYTDRIENARVEGGRLIVEARREAWRLEESLWAAVRVDGSAAGTLALVREQKERVRELVGQRKQLGFAVPDSCEAWWTEYESHTAPRPGGLPANPSSSPRR